MSVDEFAILDQIAMPVFVLESVAGGRPVYVAFNELARKAAGVRNVDDVVGRDARQVYGGRYGQAAFEKHKLAMESRQRLVYELTLPLAGVPRIMRTTLVPYPADPRRAMFSKDAFRVVGTSEDVSTTNDTREFQVQAKTLSRELEKFVGLTASDLLTPLQNVQSMSKMLRKDLQNFGEGTLRAVAMLESVALRASALVTDAISHAQSIGVVERIEEFSLTDLCGGVLIMLDPFGQHRVTVSEAAVRGNKIATQIVLRTLIDSAINSNRTSTLNMTIFARPTSNQFFELVLRDRTGALSEAALDQLAGTSSRTGPHDYGLQNIKRLVHSRGGKIAVDKTSSAQATVRIALPGRLIVNAQKEQEGSVVA